MYIVKEELASAMTGLEKKLTEHVLPLWDDLPDLELYMDQVISILSKYLKIYYEAIGIEKIVTSSMINNYVKLGTIPAPVKKKYSKVHLAYLLIICSLKQTLDIATIQTIIPVNLSEEEVKQIYNSFVKNQHKAFLYVSEHTRAVATPILNLEGDNQERLNDLLMQSSASANFFKMLTETITHLPGKEEK